MGRISRTFRMRRTRWMPRRLRIWRRNIHNWMLRMRRFENQRWLAEQCRFEFVRFVQLEVEQNRGNVRKLQNRSDPLFVSCLFRTEQAKVLRSSVRDEHEQNNGLFGSCLFGMFENGTIINKVTQDLNNPWVNHHIVWYSVKIHRFASLD